MKNGYYLCDTEDGHFWAIIHQDGKDLRAKFDTRFEAETAATVLRLLGFLDINEDFAKLLDANQD